jgi:hypothetical protein
VHGLCGTTSRKFFGLCHHWWWNMVLSVWSQGQMPVHAVSSCGKIKHQYHISWMPTEKWDLMFHCSNSQMC